jgi:hypothetical protein
MTSAFYYPQVPDSVTISNPGEAVDQSEAGRNENFPEDNQGAREYFPSTAAEISAPAVSRVLTAKKSTEPVVQTDSSKAAHTAEEWNSEKNFFTHNGLNGVVGGIQKKSTSSEIAATLVKPDSIVARQREPHTYNWLFGIFIILMVLFVWIKTFYNKFFATLTGAISSYHMSAKLFQEKNVLSHRVSTVLNFIYLIIFSIFIFELFEYLDIFHARLSSLNIFLLILNIVMIYAVARTLLLRLTGFLFLERSLFAAYIHSSYVVNKGLGIVLFPVVIMAHYFPIRLIPVILFLGVAVFSIAFILKCIRAYQIIIRKDVLLFYLFIYLCTLEFLPLLLGYKFVTSLIQSN